MPLPFVKTLAGDMRNALIPPTIVFCLFIIRVLYLPAWYQLDVGAHFLGGFSIAWMTMILWERWLQHGWISKAPQWQRDYTVWASVGIVGIAWEFFEFLMEVWLGWVMQPSIADTMNDLLMDLCGGLLFLFLYRISRKRA